MSLAARRADFYSRIPSWYSGRAHMALQNLLVFLVVAPCLWAARSASLFDWLTVPFMWVVANGIEWWIHRGPLHHHWQGLDLLYEAHTVSHHGVFAEDAMAYEHDRELAFVLFPSWFVPVAVIITAPVALLLGRLSPPLAPLWYVAGLGYFLLYEWLHLLHHSPPTGPVSGSRVACWLRQHHATHHGPRGEQGNFNISVPLWDWWMGSWL